MLAFDFVLAFGATTSRNRCMWASLTCSQVSHQCCEWSQHALLFISQRSSLTQIRTGQPSNLYSDHIFQSLTLLSRWLVVTKPFCQSRLLRRWQR
jgi:hypothetical protein